MRMVLFILISFIAITAILSGLLMISGPDGSLLSLSPSLLKETPFKNFLIPGILLTTIVGGINCMAVFYNLERNNNRYNWAIAGGVATAGWIITQMILIQTAHWLQYLYLGVGTLAVLLAYQLKGKWIV